MRFDFQQHDSLPLLAWCARVRPGGEAIQVLHGSQVETGSGFFMDGAWDGPYPEVGFDRASTFTGTGGLIQGDTVLFCPPSHILERLFAIRSGSDLLFSNSLVFLLVQAGEELDLDHPEYHLDYLRYYRAGFPMRNKTLPTASGATVRLYDGVNVRVDAALSTVLEDRYFGEPPADYSEFAGFMFRAVESVIENAAHPGRAHRYRSVAALSKGYDSPAVGALAAHGGCTDGVTFTRSGYRTPGNVAYVDDDGSEIGHLLGMTVATFERAEIHEITEPGPTELFVNPYHATERQTQILASAVGGAVFMSGRHGEQFWHLDPYASQPRLFDPGSVSMAGAASTDMRLRMGYLNFPVPYVLGVFAPALNRISRSAEMAPWRIGGSYDRPLARRLLEEAGIPREAFGQRKMGGDGDQFRKLSPPWADDFEAFYARVDPAIRSRFVEDHPGRAPHYLRGKMSKTERWLRTRPGIRNVAAPLLGFRLHHRYKCKYLYTFHWGLDRIRHRYEVEAR